MTNEPALVFFGIAWPAAKARRALIGGDFDQETKRHLQLSLLPYVSVGSGNGRPWHTATPQGFWRDFGTLNLADEDAVTAFVQRRGDPLGVMIVRVPSSSDVAQWQMPLHFGLGLLARCWTEAGERDGVSQCIGAGRDVATFWRRTLQPAIVGDVEMIAADEGVRFIPRARTLGAFMVLSAISALERAVPMRRCQHCGSWFEVRHARMRVCSATCRVAMSKQKGQK